jgi:hypothetical protein
LGEFGYFGLQRAGMLLATLCIALVPFSVAAEPAVPHFRAVERTAKGAAGHDIRVGVYVNVRPDCSSGPLPSIRLAAHPQNGKVTVKRAKVTATNYKQCLALQVPAFVAIYRSKPAFDGMDQLTLEVSYPNGRIEVQKIKVLVGESSQPGKRI